MTVQTEAFARVNLIGEHTDYNSGFVLPALLPQKTRVTAERRDDERLVAWSENLHEEKSGDISELRQNNWFDYINGCAFELRRAGFEVRGASFRVESGIPLGAGVSSSAAFEVAILRAFRELYSLTISDVEIAKVAQQAEWNFAGVKCGIMDQLVISVAKPGEALFIDTENLHTSHVSLPEDFVFATVSSGIPRTLAKSGYNQRRLECEQAAKHYGVETLRKLNIKELREFEGPKAPLSERRARHVVTENQRVVDTVLCLRKRDFKTLGEIFTASHNSLRDDYEVSIAQIDELVAQAEKAGALGARMTGAGFGGCIVALIERKNLSTWQEKLRKLSKLNLLFL